MVVTVVFACAPAVEDAPQHEEKKSFVRTLLVKGAEQLQRRKEKKAQEAQQDAAAGGEEAKPAGKIIVSKVMPALLSGPSGVAGMVREMLGIAFAELKNKYKEDVKVYVKQLGDSLAERVTQNEKVQHTMGLIKMMAWAIVIYLTLVTLLLVWMLRRLHERTARIEALLESKLGSPAQGSESGA